MRVLVCGGRDYADWGPLWLELDLLLAENLDLIVIQGGQRKWDRKLKRWVGADWASEEWAREREVPCLRVPAKWNTLGLSAGPERNERQLHLIGLPELCVAAPGGNGTADMVRRAKAAGVEVKEVS